MGPILQDKSLLSDAGLKRLEAAIASAESATSCEFIVVLAPASSRYEGKAFKAGAAVSLFVFVALYWVHFFTTGRPDALWLLAEGCVAGVCAGYAVARVPTLQRLLISRPEMHAAVTQAAGSAFREQNASYTELRNAALLYVSVLEGQARLLADVQLERKVKEARLNEVLAALLNHRGEAIEALENAIAQLGHLCADAFPRPAGDVNELPDRPIIRLP
ncbi:hypothetical protein EDM80_04550 [bacterium]|nr:MAG: hypothetical protein EDM80_04550 [bacterium]RIK65358.1 MAG: hypothetical protein DCC64_01590 [Planctomycetota bacterium]